MARTTAEGGFETIAREKEMVRLGSGPGDMKRLAPDAIDRGVAALKRFRQVADISGASVRAVATSAVREAENKDEFVRRAHDDARVEVEVVTGVEEARLIHLGVLQAVPVEGAQVLLIDIGGGSTEFVVGKGTEILEARSLKLGAIRLSSRFFPEEPAHQAPSGAVPDLRQGLPRTGGERRPASRLRRRHRQLGHHPEHRRDGPRPAG